MGNLDNVLDSVEFAREVFPEVGSEEGEESRRWRFNTVDGEGNPKSPIKLIFSYNDERVLNAVEIGQGKSGEEDHAHTNTLSELTSLALQHGIPPQALIKTLSGIQGNVRPYIGEENERKVFTSMEDIVAFQMENHVKSIKEPLNPDELKNGKYVKQILNVPDEGRADYKKLKFNSTDAAPLYLWLTENHEGLLTQVFLSRGKSGGDESAHSESLGKLISLSLRHGIHPYVVSDSLRGMHSPLSAMKPGGGGI